jgi:hypothetical protein
VAGPFGAERFGKELLERLLDVELKEQQKKEK